MRLGPALPQEGTALVVIPGIGGSARSARALASALAPVPVSVAVRPPGAAGTPEPDSIPARAEALVRRITERRPPDRLVVAGHSLGAYIALETVRRLEECAPGTVAALVVAAQLPPDRLPPHADDGFDDETVLRKVTGGAPPGGLAADPALLRVLVDQWRADYRAIDAYKPDPVVPVSTRLHVWTATDDPSAPYWPSMTAWRDYTTAPTSFAVFDGGHDFLFTAVETVAHELRRLAPDRTEVLDA